MINKDTVIKIFNQQKPLVKYGYFFKVSELNESNLVNDLVQFDSDECNNRKISLCLTEIDTIDRQHFAYFSIRISKTIEPEFDEDTSISLPNWLREKNINYDTEIFRIYPEKKGIESQLILFFDFLDEIFQIEELNKIIKGEYWEFKTTDWRLFGRE